MYVRCL